MRASTGQVCGTRNTSGAPARKVPGAGATGAPSCTANILNVPKGASTTSFVEHDREEFGYMIEGELEVIVDQTSYFLCKGDVIYFSSSLPHGYRNVSDSTAQVLWINTPPTL